MLPHEGLPLTKECAECLPCKINQLHKDHNIDTSEDRTMKMLGELWRSCRSKCDQSGHTEVSDIVFVKILRRKLHMLSSDMADELRYI